MKRKIRIAPTPYYLECLAVRKQARRDALWAFAIVGMFAALLAIVTLFSLHAI